MPPQKLWTNLPTLRTPHTEIMPPMEVTYSVEIVDPSWKFWNTHTEIMAPTEVMDPAHMESKGPAIAEGHFCTVLCSKLRSPGHESDKRDPECHLMLVVRQVI